MASDAKDTSNKTPVTGGRSSFGPPTPGVKDAQPRTLSGRGPSWLEGWPYIPLLAGSALFVALLILPRPIASPSLPLPTLDRRYERARLSMFSSLAGEVAQKPLPFDVRAVGEAFRQYGAAEARSDPDRTRYLGELQTAAERAFRLHGSSQLLGLLAFQADAFLKAASGWQATRVRGNDLIELGGAFFARVEDNGWLDSNGTLVPTPAELGVLFRARWLNLTALNGVSGLKLTLDDWRLYYAFLLRYPPASQNAPALQRLAYVDALEQKDTLYPALLARGMLRLELGHLESASDLLKTHLLAHPDGEWHLRTRNLLLTSLEHLAL